MNLLELDALAHQMIKDAGAESCYIDYHPSFGASPFGKVLCTSVNDAVLHGLPFDYVLADGDLLSVDFAASVDSWVADSALSVVVGSAREDDLKLIETTEVALAAGIEALEAHAGYLASLPPDNPMADAADYLTTKLGRFGERFGNVPAMPFELIGI